MAGLSPPLSPWQDRRFLVLLAGAGALRLALALGLWAVVALWGSHDPLEVLAFRLRSVDALGYHQQALYILEHWAGPRDFPFETFSFSLVVAAFYQVFGAHPLVMSVVAALCYTGVGLLAYSLAAELGRQRWEARILALLVCCWPPSLAWSVTPLREGPVLLMVFAMLYCWLQLLGGQRLSGRRWLVLGLGLVAAVFCLVFLRYYLWYLLWGLFLLIPLARLAPATPQRERLGWPRAAVLALLLAAGLALASPFHRNSIVHFKPAGQGNALGGWSLVSPALAAGQPPAGGGAEAGPPGQSEPARGPWERLLFELSEMRRISVRSGGASLAPEGRGGEKAVDLIPRFGDWRSGLATAAELLKASLRDLFLFPYPWQPWPGAPRWGPVQLAVAAWGVLWYLLLPGLAAGLVIGLRQRPAATLTLALWGLGLGICLGIAILNRGTLFRLREMALLPLLLLWHPWPYLKLWQLLHRPSQPAP